MITKPEINEGETYIGAIIHADGTGHHIILLTGDIEATWAMAMEWAKVRGGDLPDRTEQAMMYANHRDQFDNDAAYWSNTTDEDGDGWAWCQDFFNGTQATSHKRHALRARAVRRVPLEATK
jgi:hypothetical protein